MTVNQLGKKKVKNRGASDGGGRPTPGDLALAHTKRSEGSEPARRSEGEVCSELRASAHHVQNCEHAYSAHVPAKGFPHNDRRTREGKGARNATSDQVLMRLFSRIKS